MHLQIFISSIQYLKTGLSLGDLAGPIKVVLVQDHWIGGLDSDNKKIVGQRGDRTQDLRVTRLSDCHVVTGDSLRDKY